MSRYDGRFKATNSEEMYENLLEKRQVKQIVQYTTPILKYPTESEKEQIDTIKYTWKQGDKYWRLASQYYQDPTLWWIIAQFNKKPTEMHLEIGDELEIPLDLSVVLGSLS
jgi:nucleoid-associated protein YgaU